MASSEGISAAEVQAATKDALNQIASATSIAELKKVRASVLGDHSSLASFSARLGKLPAEQKAEAGKLVGSARSQVGEAFEKRESALGLQEEKNETKTTF